MCACSSLLPHVSRKGSPSAFLSLAWRMVSVDPARLFLSVYQRWDSLTSSLYLGGLWYLGDCFSSPDGLWHFILWLNWGLGWCFTLVLYQQLITSFLQDTSADPLKRAREKVQTPFLSGLPETLKWCASLAQILRICSNFRWFLHIWFYLFLLYRQTWKNSEFPGFTQRGLSLWT